MNYEDNDDDTIFAFSPDKKVHHSTEVSSPMKTKSSAYSVPKHNPYMMDSAKKELRNDDTIIAAINIIVCGLSFLQHNLFFENGYTSTDFISYLRIIILVLSMSSILWIVRRYEIKLIMLLIRYQVSIYDNIFTIGLYKPMLFEIFLTVLVIPPYIDYAFDISMLGFTMSYSMSAVFTFFSMVKLYVIVRLFGHYTEYTQAKAETICSKHGILANAFFALKCYVQDSPFTGIGMFFFGMSLFSSIALKLCEEPSRKYFGQDDITESSLSALWDNLWAIFYTTTTIGYGNIYPYTHLGRGICIVACILGNMYLGMLVVTIHQRMGHDPDQNLSYAWISRIYIKKDIEKHARLAIRKAVTLYMLSKKWGGRVISPVKPNGAVNCKGVLVRNDMNFLSNSQYLKKVALYRDLREHLNTLRELSREAREIGQNDFDVIKNFEDVVRIEFPIIIKKIKNKIAKNAVGTSEELAKACKPCDLKSHTIREFTKNLKRKLGHMLRRKTVIPNGQVGNLRNSGRALTNF